LWWPLACFFTAACNAGGIIVSVICAGVKFLHQKNPRCTASALAQCSKVKPIRVALRAVLWHEFCNVEAKLNIAEAAEWKNQKHNTANGSSG